MRRFPLVLLLLLCFVGALRAADSPTLKPDLLADLTVPQGGSAAPIDLRNYFEISSITGQVVQFRTNMGTFNLELLADAAPVTVENFLKYVNSSRYANTMVHRSDKGLGVIQGGGYVLPIPVNRITADPPIALEYNLPNTRGTIAMARTSVQNSATSEWFINTADNTTNLGQANGGGYAVFGRVTGTGMTVVDAIAALPTENAGSPFTQLPLNGYTSGPITANYLVVVQAAQAVPLFPSTPGQTAVASFSVANSNPALLTASVSGSSLSVTGKPGQSGFADLTVTATDTNGNSVQDTVRVTILPPEIGVVPSGGAELTDEGTAVVPQAIVGYSSELEMTLRNSGSGLLTFHGARASLDGPNAADFSLTSLPPASVTAGGSATFVVRFAPHVEGTKTAWLRIANNDSDEAVFDIQLTATAKAVTTTLLAKGQPVPGAGGVDNRIPAESTWGTFGTPSITMNGTAIVGWLGTVRVPGTVGFSGIFAGPIGAPALKVRTGETIANGAGEPVAGVKFKSFRAPVLAGPDFAFGATVAGTKVVSLVNDSGVWANVGGTLREIARTGSLAPETNSKYLAITSVAMPAPGVVFYTAKLAAPVGKEMGLWAWTPAGGSQLVVRKGLPVDLGSGPVLLTSFTALSSVTGSFGHGRYDPSAPEVDVLLRLATGVTAIARASSDGALHLVQQSNVTDSTGRLFQSVGIPSSPGLDQSPSGVASFAPNPALGITAASARSIYDFEAQEILAQLTRPAIGAAPAKFLTFQSPVAGFGLAGERITAFGATLSGATATRSRGLWQHNDSDGLTLLAQAGAQPPDAPRTKWASFASLSILEGRGPIFIARLVQTPPAVTAANDLGLWATDSTGALRLLVRTGDSVGGKKLKSFSLLGAVAGSSGQRRAWCAGDLDAQIVYQGILTDGSSVILSTVVP